MITPWFQLPLDLDDDSVVGDVSVLLSRLPELVPRLAVERILELLLRCTEELADLRSTAERLDEALGDLSWHSAEVSRLEGDVDFHLREACRLRRALDEEQDRSRELERELAGLRATVPA